MMDSGTPNQRPRQADNLEQQLRFLSALINATVDAIIVHEPDGQIVFCNSSALDLLGISEAELRARGPFGWVAPEYRAGGADRLELILHEGRLSFDSAVVDSDGKHVPTEVTASRLDTDEGPLVVAVIRDISQWAESQARMQYLAYHDALTGLHNRPYFEDELRRAVAASIRHGDLLVLAYLDLDHFKPVNDRHGHERGDIVLREVANRLRRAVREQDLVTRLGGDEFVVLFHRVESCDELGIIANRLLEAVREPIELDEGGSVVIDASIGFSVFDADVDDVRSLIVKADIAMYAAKTDPVATWRTYDATMGTSPDIPRREAQMSRKRGGPCSSEGL